MSRLRDKPGYPCFVFQAPAATTSPLESDHAPAFSPDRRTLFFLSARHDRPVLSDRDQGPDIVAAESDGLYRVSLPPSAIVPPPGFTRDAVAVTTAPGVLSNPEMAGATLFYTAAPADPVNGAMPGAPVLHALNTTTGRDRVVATGSDDVVVSRDGAMLLAHDGAGARSMLPATRRHSTSAPCA